jgi:FtsH-binding integral membrane protein
MRELLTLHYWFSIRAIPFQPAIERGLLLFFGAVTVTGLVISLALLKKGYAKPIKRSLGRIASLFTWSGAAGLALWAFAYQGVPVLSMRFFYVLWAAWVIFGLYSVFRYVWIEVPRKRKMYEERIEREKWLPKKK